METSQDKDRGKSTWPGINFNLSSLNATRNHKMPTITKLPIEILVEIFSYFDIQHRQRFARVCKQWNVLIKSMWQGENKLILHNRRPGIFMPPENCPIICCNDYLNMGKILKNFDGNLKKLRLQIGFVRMQVSEKDKIGWRYLCDQIRINKQLNTVEIKINVGNEEELTLELLESLPTKNLRNLSISGVLLRKCGKLIETIEELLRRTSGLEFLYLEKYTFSMMEIIEKMKSLNSLHLMFCTDFISICPVPLNFAEFANLRELTLLNCHSAEENFLETLGNECKTLVALKLNCSSITQNEFNYIGEIKSLTHLQLMMIEPFDYKVLMKLTNLEELQLKYNQEHANDTSRIQLQHIFVRLYKLKRGWFDDGLLHRILKFNMIKRQFHLQPVQNIHLNRWNEAF